MQDTIPMNIEAEMGVIGSIIIDPEALLEIAEFLEPSHFYRSAHRTIYATIVQLFERREPADFITLCDELGRVGKLEDVGGAQYITSLINRVPTSGNLLYYARIVERKGILRQLIQMGSDIVAAAYEDQENVLEMAEDMVYRLRQGSNVKQVVSHVEALSRYLTGLEKLHDEHANGALTGIPTAFPLLNTILGGFRHSKMYVLAARPGDGKTALALNFADKAVKSDFNVLFFSLEMDEEELMQRWVAMEAKIDSTKLRDGRIDLDEKGKPLPPDEHGKTEWDRIMEADARLRALPGQLFIDDTPGNTNVGMRSKARRVQAEHGLDFIIVDYLQFARVPEDRKLENRRLEVEEVSRSLKNLARELKVPVLALAQLNREVESRAGRKPQLSDLREAGGIEQDCDVAMFIQIDPNTEEGAKQWNLTLNIEKHRNGSKGIVPLRYFGPMTKFYPLVKEVQQ
jgi:replicative DNA helicase